MLGSFGLWSSSKGMVLVPNLSGLTNTQAIAAIQSAGLNYSGSSTTTTSDISLSNKIVSQLPNANDLVAYESDVSFIYYNYVATTTTTTTTPAPPPTTTTTTTTTSAPPPTTTTTTTTTSAPPPTTTTTTTTTTSAPAATISNLTYTKTGSTTGTLSWTGSNISSYLFTGNSSNYPAPYNYGAYTATWPGNLVNLVEGQSYTVTITVMPGGASQTITFTQALATTTTTTTTSAPPPTTTTTTTTTTTPALYTIWSGCYNGVTQGAGYGNGPEAAGWVKVFGTTNNPSLTESEIRSLIGGGCPATTTTTTTVAPTTTTTTTPMLEAWYAIGCCDGTVVRGSSVASESNALDNLDAACTGSLVGVTQIATVYGTGYPTTPNCTTPAPTTTTTTTPATYCRNEVRTVSSAQCPSTQANYNVCYSSPSYTGEVSATFTSCIGSTTTTTTTAAGTPAPPTTTTTTTVAPTTTTTTTPGSNAYWYTGCCSSSGSQVTGTSSSSFGEAFNSMNAQCSGGTITSTTSGNYGTIPTLSCPATTTTTTTTPGPTGTVKYVVGGSTAPACDAGFTTSTTGSGTGSGSSVSTPCGTFYVPNGVPYAWRCCVADTTTTVAPTTTTTTTASSAQTWYFCCNDGSGGTVQSSSSGLAAPLASSYCNSIGSTGPSSGVYSTPQSCNSPTTTAAPVTTTTSAPVTTTAAPVPSGGSVSLTGGSTPGSVITASTSGWSGSPTSYSVIITTSTSGTPTANSTVVASGTSSATYTITSTDAVSPVNIFKAFATATNSSGTSTQIGSGTISATPAATTAAPTTTTAAPTTTTAAPTYCRNEVIGVSTAQCASGNATYNRCYSNADYTGFISQTFVSCVGGATTTSAPATTTAAPATTTAAPATTTASGACTQWTCSYYEWYEGFGDCYSVGYCGIPYNNGLSCCRT